ncbi:MipA/OmpV family protein [Psychrobacter sp. FDAARGOS_221]|uniref:MipA/OmpV family protein n=1 Tax=Psychrobacter sp. FDAARGOS_221 TaxID=1975705 RepID=UPI00187D539B|nr:MipA/OmpV family protein [Psychrobacter sp. FDAARGOS_221]
MLTPVSLLTMILLSSQAVAQDQPNASNAEDNSQLSVGVSAMYVNNAYDADNKVRVLPSIYYDNGQVYLKGIQLGGYLYDDDTSKVTAFIQPGGNKFDPDDANGALRGLDKRKVSGMAGVGYQRRVSYALVSAQLATDVLSNSKGTTAKLSVGTRLPLGKVMVMPSIGVEWVNDNYNEYYYGVSEKESAQTGVRNYKPGSSINPYINVSANYKINQDWSLFLGQAVSYLPDEQYDSPMVDDRVSYRTTLGVSYDF